MKKLKGIYSGNFFTMTNGKKYELTERTCQNGTYRYYEVINDRGNKQEFFTDSFKALI